MIRLEINGFGSSTRLLLGGGGNLLMLANRDWTLPMPVIRANKTTEVDSKFVVPEHSLFRCLISILSYPIHTNNEHRLMASRKPAGQVSDCVSSFL